MKILYVTTISLTMGFFPEHIKMLQKEGHVVELAANMTEPLKASVAALNCKFHQIDFSRNPLDKNNPKAYQQLKKLLKEEKYDIVHTHTPIASAMVRMAARKLRKNGLKVFYTAHGFHFYKGAPLKNWLLYYSIEKFCSYFTDVQITINKEDYELAKNKFHMKKLYYVPGVGLDVLKFTNCYVDAAQKRQELGIPVSSTWILSVGELNANKNHEVILKAMVDNPSAYYTIAGLGTLDEYLMHLAKSLKIEDRFQLLGYRNDIAELCKSADIFTFPSKSEGLPVSVMEAMACGIPIVGANIRGVSDLIDPEGGILVNPYNAQDVSTAIHKIATIDTSAMRIHNQKKVKNYSIESIVKQMKIIYDENM